MMKTIHIAMVQTVVMVIMMVAIAAAAAFGLCLPVYLDKPVCRSKLLGIYVSQDTFLCCLMFIR